MTRPGKVLALVLVAALLIVGYVGAAALRFRYLTGRHVADRESLGEAVALFNPFRAMEPERLAQSLLAALARGECGKALVAPAFTEDDRLYLCGNEESIPMGQFALIGRKDGDDKAFFVFRTQVRLAGSQRRFQAYACVDTERRDGAWLVTKYYRVRDPLTR